MVITSITDENIKTFDNLISEDISAKLAEEESWFALGAICPKDDSEYAAGVLIFSIDEGSNGEEDLTAAVIRWLYVSKDFRRKGTAESLMRELFRILEISRVEHILCDIPMPEEYNEICAYLESWGFDVSLTDVYEATFPLRDVVGHPLIKSVISKGKILPLANIPEFYFKNYINKEKNIPGVLRTLSINTDSYDKDVSCVFLENSNIEGALLIRREKGVGLEVMFMRASKNVSAAMMNMLFFAVRAASGKYPLDTAIHIICRLAASASIIAKLFPQLKPILVRRAYYSMYEIDSKNDLREEDDHG